MLPQNAWVRIVAWCSGSERLEDVIESVAGNHFKLK